ncbi:MAG: hypothetical protein AB7V27_13220 [Candidatus Binatia bacterium]
MPAALPMLQERNGRTGFFEREQLEAVRRRFPAPLQAVVRFAYLTGWRVRARCCGSNGAK